MSAVADARRKQILAAAQSCFVKQGFHQASMNDICVAAEMSPGSVYRYFRSKSDIIAAMVDDCREKVRAWFVELAQAKDMVVGLGEIADRILAELNDPAEHVLYFESTAEAMRNPKVATALRNQDSEEVLLLTEALKRWQAAGQIDPDLNPTLTAHTLSALVDGFVWRKFLTPDVHTPAYAETLRTLLTRFLRPQTPRAHRRPTKGDRS